MYFVLTFLSFLLLAVLLCTFIWLFFLLLATMTGAPIVYSSKKAVKDALKLSEIKKGETIVDLGCGNGETLILAAKEFGARGIGIDRSPFCYFKAKFNVWKAGESSRIKIIYGNFQKRKKALKRADVVYMYLLNDVLKKIEPWFFEAINNKTRVVSLAFKFINHKPAKEVLTETLGRSTKIRFYIKEENEGKVQKV